MHAVQRPAFLLDTLEDGLARGDGSLPIHVVTGTVFGMLQLEGDAVHDVAGYQLVVREIEGVAGSVAVSREGLHTAGQGFVRSELHQTLAVGSNQRLHVGRFFPGIEFGGRDVELGLGEDCLTVFQEATDVVAMQVGDEDGVDVRWRETQCLQLWEHLRIVVAIAGIEEQLLAVLLQKHHGDGGWDAVGYA